MKHTPIAHASFLYWSKKCTVILHWIKVKVKSDLWAAASFTFTYHWIPSIPSLYDDVLVSRFSVDQTDKCTSSSRCLCSSLQNPVLSLSGREGVGKPGRNPTNLADQKSIRRCGDQTLPILIIRYQLTVTAAWLTANCATYTSAAIDNETLWYWYSYKSRIWQYVSSNDKDVHNHRHEKAEFVFLMVHSKILLPSTTFVVYVYHIDRLLTMSLSKSTVWVRKHCG